MQGTDFDVVVVGGGVSGAYAAWRLVTDAADDATLARNLKGAEGPLRIGVFEGGDSKNGFGGRLKSVALPAQENNLAELGGMRFLKSHKRVFQLVEHLGLEYKELPVADPRNMTLAYLRGHLFRAGDVNNLTFEPPYRLDRGERGRSPGSLLIEFALRHEFGAEKLRNEGIWNRLLKEMSQEAYQLLREGGGYDTLVHNWCAAEAVPFLLADFAPDALYLALKKGFQELPRQLGDRFQKAGGHVAFGHRLHRIDQEDDSRFRLTFDTAPQGTSYRFRRVAQEKVCRTRHLILAMPRRSLELLHPDSVIFDIDRFEFDLKAVLPQKAFKIFAAYRKPWWQQRRGVEAGRSVTDLPIRQCYYWNTAPDGPSTLMASYSDGNSQEFWAGLAREHPRYSPDPRVCPPGIPIPDDIQDLSASAALVEELHGQLLEMHALARLPAESSEAVPYPYVVVSKDWSQEPFGGGWHFWKIGVNSHAVARRIRQPDPARYLYICGEAWSHQQGWVEGALETAEDMLQQNLHLPAPVWLKL